MQSLAHPTVKATWLTEVIAAWGFVQRNYFLTKRYIGWELVWLLYTTGNAMSIGYIGASVDAGTGGKALTTYLLISLGRCQVSTGTLGGLSGKSRACHGLAPSTAVAR